MLHFVGLVGFNRPAPDMTVLAAAGRRLGGPAFGPVATWCDRGCALAFRQRPLRRPAGANAPVIGRGGTLVLVGSGRIDRREELITGAGLDPHHPWSDAELMMVAVDRWGEQAANRLHGDFAFAAWDSVARRLILARDCFGTVPLFHHRGDGFAAFSTNPAALLALGIVPGDLDPAALGQHLRGIALDSEATVYRHIRRVPRATQTIHDAAGWRNDTYWRPRRGPPLRLKDDHEYVEAAREVLADVLRGHLRTTAPIGVMLSGGFDSGALASTLALLAPDREILGFTSVPQPHATALPPGNEREWQHVQRLARLWPNLRVQAVAEKRLSPLDAFWRDVFADIGMPVAGMGLAARRLALGQAAREQGVGTLLRGDGGNRTLTGEGEDVFRHLFRTGRWFALLREIHGMARNRSHGSHDPLWTRPWRAALRDIAPTAMLKAWHAWRGRPSPSFADDSLLRGDFAEASGLEDQWKAAPNHRDKLACLPRAEIEPVYLSLQPPWAEAYTLLFNRMGMECSAPLRDRRMVDFILSVPADQFRRNGVPRYLARRVLADRMPPEVLAEPGYFDHFADMDSWLAGWWKGAAGRIADHHPVDLAAAMIDLPRLCTELSKGPPREAWALPARLREGYEGFLPMALHINDFLRWHAGAND